MEVSSNLVARVLTFAMLRHTANVPLSKYRSVHRSAAASPTGVLLFDEIHGQAGVAPNCVELHPILTIR